MGAWRLEVAPGAPRAHDRFLHVLTAADTSATAPKIEKVVTDTQDGVIVTMPNVRRDGWLGSVTATFLFNRTGEVGGTVKFSFGSEEPLATTIQPQHGLAPLK
jgi:hypothetical protein